MLNMWDMVASRPELSQFASYLRRSGLEFSLMNGLHSFTIFAPNNRAFETACAEEFSSMLDCEEQLLSLMKFHIVPERLWLSDIIYKDNIRTLESGALSVSMPDAVFVNDAEIVQPDILCSNGIVHVVDCLLVPAT